MFEEFWSVYPRREDKKKAQIVWNKLSQAKKEKAILDCKTRYRGIERCFIPLPTTYLRGERWEDDPIPRRQEIDWDKLASQHARPGETMEQFKCRFKP